jgi:regulatory protein
MAGRRRSRIRDLSPDPAVAARQARDLCLRMLTDRARTRHELAEVLAAEGVDDEIAATVLARLTELRLIDDAAYAEAFVRSRQRAGVAKRTIARELRAKGVDDDQSEAALENIEPEQERETAVLLASRRAGRTSGLPQQVRRRRLHGLLIRRGYPADLVLGVIDQVLGEDADEVSGDDEGLEPDALRLSDLGNS